jgi:plastocyanin
MTFERSMSALAAVVTGAMLLVTLACGGDSSNDTPPTSPTPTPPPSGGPAPSSVTITISNNAVSPQNVTVAVGGRVTFVNSDTRAHEMNSDPHPDHTDCPALNQVGFLNPGQSRESGNLTTARTCGFHDHNQDSNAALRGRITIQ